MQVQFPLPESSEEVLSCPDPVVLRSFLGKETGSREDRCYIPSRPPSFPLFLCDPPLCAMKVFGDKD